MVEISSQQYLNATRGLETSRPSSVNFNSISAPESSTEINREEQTPSEKREQRNSEQSVARQLVQLQNRDREVRAHEAAHVAAGGRYVSGGPSFTYQRGPNGRFYAVGGEVQIDTSPVASNPQATLDKAEVIKRAALAPAQPSPQDLRVASNASRLASRARVEIAIQQRQQQETAAAQRDNKNSEEGGSGAIESGNGSIVASGYGNETLAEPARDVFDIVA